MNFTESVLHTAKSGLVQGASQARADEQLCRRTAVAYRNAPAARDAVLVLAEAHAAAAGAYEAGLKKLESAAGAEGGVDGAL